jgi:hypothetical protein
MNWDDCSRDQVARPYYDERDAIFKAAGTKAFPALYAAVARRVCGNCVGLGTFDNRQSTNVRFESFATWLVNAGARTYRPTLAKIL